MTTYATNQTHTNVGILGSRYLIPIGGWVELSDEDVKNREVLEAVRRGWVKLTETEPGTAEEFKAKIEMSEPAIHGSKTIPKAKKATA
jgi:hypothetical protein